MAVRYSVVGVKNDVESFNGETMIYSVAARFRLSCLQEYKMSRSTNGRKERKCAYFARFLCYLSRRHLPERSGGSIYKERSDGIARLCRASHYFKLSLLHESQEKCGATRRNGKKVYFSYTFSIAT